jgi:hypothetical protein
MARDRDINSITPYSSSPREFRRLFFDIEIRSIKSPDSVMLHNFQREPPRGGTMLEPGLPTIHPSFIQVANPYIFEQTVENCIASMGVNPLRETSLRLQGVAWLDGVRRALNL